MYENLGSRILRRTRLVRVAIIGVAGLSVACDAPRSPSRDSATIREKHQALGAALGNVSTVALHAPRSLTENSSASMSARQPGVFFSINDSGNDALLFALDTTGADRGVWRVAGATNVDWEATAMGPCAAGGAASCIYIGDVGDNDAVHQSRTIYRVAEPDATTGVVGKKPGLVTAEALQYRYQDRPHDVEAMYVPPNGDVVLITKRPSIVRLGKYRQALVFRLPSSLWGAKGVSIAMLVDSLPIIPGSAPFRLITDAALSPDAKHLAVRTYAQVYIFATDSLTGAVNHDIAPSVCDITTLSEFQGEGVTWVNNAGRLLFTSEGRRAPLHIADCALPSSSS
jgi:hypothetical protein